MKIHYTVHVLMLGAIVYLAAQFNNSSKNTIDFPVENKVEIDTSTIEDQISDLKKEISDKEIEMEILEKSNEIAQEKIRDLKSEIAKLSKKKDQAPEMITGDIQNQIKNALDDSLFDSTHNNSFSKKKYYKKYYQRLFGKLGLSEEQQEEFLDILDKNKSNTFMTVNGVPVGGNDNNEELKQFLGSNYEDYLKYTQTSMERNQLDRMNKKLSDENKLTPDQHELLTDIMHQKKLDKMAGKDVNDQDYLDQSSAILNETQQQEFEKQLKTRSIPFGDGVTGTIIIQ